MKRGKTALLVPSDGADLKALSNELQKHEVEILGQDGGLIFVRWEENAMVAVPQIRDLQGFHLDEISQADAEALAPPAQRLVKLWNWSFQSAERHVTDAEVSRLLQSVDIEIRADDVLDRIADKSLGKVRRGEKTYKSGDWDVIMHKSWEMYPVAFPFGYLWKFQNDTETTPTVADLIIAQVIGPKHFANSTAYNTTAVSAYDWSLVWPWESLTGTRAFSYAMVDGVAKWITSSFFDKP